MVTEELRGKKVLFISVRFFGYEEAIVKRLRDYGAEVDFYDDRPSNSILHRGLLRVHKGFVARMIRNYYEKIFREIKDNTYDYFLLIKGEAIPQSFLRKIKDHFPAMRRIGYTYDSLEEFGGFKDIIPYMDDAFTFEPADAERYKMNFRPLFYLDQYLQTPKSEKTEFDVLFIGSAHTDRFLIGEKIRENLESMRKNYFFHYFAPSKAAFFFKKIFDKNLKVFKMSRVSCQSFSHQEIVRLYGASKSVLDINKPHQNGITIRSFEALAAGRKLITTNRDIVKYPFYKPENILVIDRENPVITEDFLDMPTVPLDARTVYMMSLDAWLECLFVKNQNDYWLK